MKATPEWSEGGVEEALQLFYGSGFDFFLMVNGSDGGGGREGGGGGGTCHLIIPCTI